MSELRHAPGKVLLEVDLTVSVSLMIEVAMNKG